MRLELLFSEPAVPSSEILHSGGAERAKLRAELDRRAHRRLSANELHWLQVARFEHGPSVTLIDLSAGGVLLESHDRLCPGSTLALELVGSNQVVVPLRVVRSQIASLQEGLLYRGACAFRRPLELPDLVVQSSSAALQSSATTAAPSASPSSSPEAPGSSADQRTAGWSLVVLRYLDGRPVRGYCKDFSASHTEFHLWPSVGAPPSQLMIVPLSRLKAVFFVRDFDGNPAHVERQTFATAPHGRKVEITFHDGEVIVGSTLNYRPEGSGFFLCPADSRSNNVRIFVVCASVRHARFI
jgi:hypothetical protein